MITDCHDTRKNEMFVITDSLFSERIDHSIGLLFVFRSRLNRVDNYWFALKAVQTFEFGGVDKKCVYKHITFSRFLAYEGVIIMHMIIIQYKVLFK